MLAVSDAVLIAFITSTATIIGAIVAGIFALRSQLIQARQAADKAAANTTPNDGSSPYDRLVMRLDSISRQTDVLTEDAIDAKRERAQLRGHIQTIDEAISLMAQHLAATDAHTDALHDYVTRRNEGRE